MKTKLPLAVAYLLAVLGATLTSAFGCSEGPGEGTGGSDAGDGSAASSSGNTGSLGTGGGSGSGGSYASGGSSGSGGHSSGSGGSGSGDFEPCPATGTCKILPLGDSITDGFGVPGGYRIPLFELGLEANKDITFIGRASNGPDMVTDQAFPKNHEGYSGYTINGLSMTAGIPENLDDTPHIVLLHIGTNDLVSTDPQQPVAEAPHRLDAFLDELVGAWPDALIVVAQIIPLPFAASAVNTYNAAIPGIVEAHATAGEHVVLVDQFSDFPANGVDQSDTVHPNTTGYAAMADVWFAAIEPYLP